MTALAKRRAKAVEAARKIQFKPGARIPVPKGMSIEDFGKSITGIELECIKNGKSYKAYHQGGQQTASCGPESSGEVLAWDAYNTESSMEIVSPKRGHIYGFDIDGHELKHIPFYKLPAFFWLISVILIWAAILGHKFFG